MKNKVWFMVVICVISNTSWGSTARNEISPSLQTNLCECTLENPFIIVSGVWGSSTKSLLQAVHGGCGAVTTKSVNTIERKGHKKPVFFDWKRGYINAMGLPGPGAQKTTHIIQELKNETTVPIIASIFGHTIEEFVQVCEHILKGDPDIIEVNMSCPNVQDECGIPFACDALLAKQTIAAIKAVCNKPIFAKLAPNVPNIARIAQACVQAGADGIVVINTMPGMVIDVYKQKPILTNKSGGLSGPAIKPIAIKAVYDIRSALPDIPIIGIGGVTNGIDAIEMIMAGATAVGIGSAIYRRGIDVFEKLVEEVTTFMQENGFNNLDEIRNLAHK